MRWIASIAHCAILATCSLARAQSAHAVTLVGAADGCPSHRAFGDALRVIFPDATIATDDRTTELRVELSDSGTRYRVVAGTVSREFDDPAGRCDERARNAAVFVALVLDPPRVDLAALEAPTVDPVAPIAAASSAVVHLGIGGLFDTAPRSQNVLASGGGRLELAIGGEAIRAVLGVDVESPATMELGTVRARLTRVPFSLGARGSWRRGSWTISLDAGVVMAIQITSGLDTPQTSEQTRLELGLRAAPRLEYWAWKRAAPFVAIQGELIPSSYDLVWSGMGVVGTTPHAWLGGVAGCEFALR